MINKKKRTCWIVDFAVPADHRVKLKENEKKASKALVSDSKSLPDFLGLPGSSEYSCQSQQYCSLDGFNCSSDF